MIKCLLLLFLMAHAEAYVPTVESLLRHGGNPDVSANGVSLTLVVKKVQQGENNKDTENASLLKEGPAEDYYKIFFSRAGDSLKITQARFEKSDFSDNSVLQKVYFPNFNAYTLKPDVESAAKGLFFNVLNTIIFNNGYQMVSYLKSMGVPVKHNNEIINREKVEFLADYKRYLVTVAKDRNARKTEVNPLQPEDPAARERAEFVMGSPMYVDLQQVKLAKDAGNISWVINAGAFEAVLSHKERNLQRIRYKTTSGDFEIVYKDYWLANGTHYFPRYILIKTFNGEQYQIEITAFRHYMEKEDELIRRLRSWDQVLKGKESTDPRPEFLL